MSLRFLIVSNFYRDFLDGLYAAHPGLADVPYDRQLHELMATSFGVADAYSYGLRQAGCDAFEVISNASPLQRRWAAEYGFAVPDVRTWHHDVLEAQVRAIRPDVVLVFEYNPIGDGCLRRIKPHTRLLIGQIASHLPANRTFQAYHLIVSSWPPIVEHFQRHGRRGRYLPLAFDERVLPRIALHEPRYDLTFVGGLAECHDERIDLLERVCAERQVDVWGYGVERLRPDSPIRRHYHGPCWGIEMYQVLRDSRITINVHGRIDVPGSPETCCANNMRMYEATGVRTCLLTDDRTNLSDHFEPQIEVATYRDAEECSAQVDVLLGDEAQRESIARAGQARTLRRHTYAHRMTELWAISKAALDGHPRRRAAIRASV